MARRGTAKELFVQRALDMFLKNGVRTTMDEISRQLKISKRTIYEQFEDKTDLMRACVNCLLKDCPELPDQESDDIVGNIYLAVRDNVLNLFGQRSRFILSLQTYYPELYDELISPVIGKVLDYLQASFEKSKEKGFVREDFNAEVYFSYFIKYVFYITSDMDNLFKKHTHFELFHSAILPMLRGVLTEGGMCRMDAVIAENKKK